MATHLYVILGFLLFICYLLLKYSSKTEVVWFPKTQIPKIEGVDSWLSKDVLLYDCETRKAYVGYYNHRYKKWVLFSNDLLPEFFRWREIEIDID